MADVPKWFPRTMVDLYRQPGKEPSINDPRVAAAYGGGMLPEQHWGVLTDGRVFYFRYRSGTVRLHLGPDWLDPDELPASDPRVTREVWENAWATALAAANGDPSKVPNKALPERWLGPVGRLNYGDALGGYIGRGSELDAVFGQLLDQVWNQPFDTEGWELYRSIPKESG